MATIQPFTKELSFPYNAVLQSDGTYDRLFDANDFAKDRATFLSDGVFVNPSNNFQVAAQGGNMNIIVGAASGRNTAFIQGRSFVAEGQQIISVPAAHTQYARIDLVTIWYSASSRKTQIYYFQGTASASPVKPSLYRDSTNWEIQLAQITVPANATTIQDSNILDTRSNTNLCGIVTCLGLQGTTPAVGYKRMSVSSSATGNYLKLTTDYKPPTSGSESLMASVHIRGRLDTIGNVDSVLTVHIASGAINGLDVRSSALALNYGTKAYKDSDGYLCLQMYCCSGFKSAIFEYSMFTASKTTPSNINMLDRSVVGGAIATTDTSYTGQYYVSTWNQENAMQPGWSCTIPTSGKLANYVNSLGHVIAASVTMTVSANQTDNIYFTGFRAAYNGNDLQITIAGAYQKFNNCYITGNPGIRISITGANTTTENQLFIRDSFCKCENQTLNHIGIYDQAYVEIDSSTVNNDLYQFGAYLHIKGSGTINNLGTGDASLSMIASSYSGTIKTRSNYYSGGEIFDRRTSHFYDSFTRK